MENSSVSTTSSHWKTISRWNIRKGLRFLKIDAGFGVGTEKPGIEEFLNGNFWQNNLTRTNKEKGFRSYGVDSQLGSLSPMELFC
jgi:hypothetical protein